MLVSLALAAIPALAGGEIAAEPFAPRSGPRGGTLFKNMSAAETGIVTENDFADPKMWGEHYREFSMGTVGTGVAIGDYDGDGRPDVFVVSKTGPCRLFRNLGHWKFEDVTDKAGLGGAGAGWIDTAKSWVGLGGDSAGDSPDRWKQGAVFADVNNDGRLDLYVCRFNAPNWLFINQGDGTFREEAATRGLALVDACGVGAFCDYDRDGWLDVYVTTSMRDATQHPNGERGHLLHNKGDGTFAEVTAQAGIAGEALSHSATWWDQDGDGWPDLYVANDFAGADRLYHNNRDGTFSEVIDQAVPHMPYSSMGADLGDVDNDGRVDLFVADMAATTHEKDQRGMAYSRSLGNTVDPLARGAAQYSHNALYLATGTPRCREAAYLAGLEATDWTWAPRFEDLDNDGRLDLFVTNGMCREFQNADLLDRSVRAESTAERVNIMRAGPILAEPNLAYRNLGDLRFVETGASWGLNQHGVSFGAAFGDLDGDGDLDIVFANYQAGVTVLRNDSDTGHRLVVALRGTHSNRFGAGATVRIKTASGVQVRQLVLARGYLSSSEPVLHFGLGDDTKIAQLTVEWPGGAVQTFDDLAVDQKFTITEPTSPAVAATVPPAALGQVAVRTTAGASIKRSPQFEELKQAPPNTARFERTPARADFDRDGQLDEFIGAGAQPGKYPVADHSALLANRDGKLVDVTDTLAPGLREIGIVTAALWSDVDADGWPDLLVACEWGRVSCFHNHQGQRFEDWTEKLGFSSGGTGWWTALAAADFNGDGRPDYVAGNVGLNTQYRADPEHPALLFLGDFAGRGRPQLIEAYYEGDKLYPWRTRKELGAQIPSVLKRYSRNDTYARAGLTEIVGADTLAAAQRFTATELRSGVFLSQGDGTLHFEPLPRIAQIAPSTSIVIADFDGDGRADIYAVQNSPAPNGGHERFDGGVSQLLLGDGHGHFTPVPPAESGLIVPGTGNSVVVTDFDRDDWPDLVVTRADGQIRAFHNLGVPGHHPGPTAKAKSQP